MTPDTLTIDRTFRGVGRIKKATGSSNAAMRRKLSRMLTALYDDGHLDTLRAIRDGVPGCSLMEVWSAFQRKALHVLPTGQTVAALGEAFGAWMESLVVPDDYSADHVRTMGTTKKYLSVPGATVNDLAAVLEELRKTLGKRAPRSFNLTRAHALAFVRATLKASHPVYLACAAVERRKQPKRKKGGALPVDLFRNYFPAPATDPVDAMAWTMATTGMHQKEYWGTWATKGDRVHVEGQKREGRVRDVPLVLAPVRPSMHVRTWEDKVRERFAGTGHVPYDMRRTYAHWMELAQIPRTRRRLYLGHGSKDVTDLYERHELDAYLAGDGLKLRALLGLPDPKPTLRLERAKS